MARVSFTLTTPLLLALFKPTTTLLIYQSLVKNFKHVCASFATISAHCNFGGCHFTLLYLQTGNTSAFDRHKRIRGTSAGWKRNARPQHFLKEQVHLSTQLAEAAAQLKCTQLQHIYVVYVRRGLMLNTSFNTLIENNHCSIMCIP